MPHSNTKPTRGLLTSYRWRHRDFSDISSNLMVGNAKTVQSLLRYFWYETVGSSKRRWDPAFTFNVENCNDVLFIRLQRLRHRPRLLRRLRLRLEGGRCFRRPEGLRPDLRRQWPRHCCSRSGQITNTVVPGFKALGPSTALSALNPGTISLSYKEIVFKLMVDLNNWNFF